MKPGTSHLHRIIQFQVPFGAAQKRRWYEAAAMLGLALLLPGCSEDPPTSPKGACVGVMGSGFYLTTTCIDETKALCDKRTEWQTQFSWAFSEGKTCQQLGYSTASNRVARALRADPASQLNGLMSRVIDGHLPLDVRDRLVSDLKEANAALGDGSAAAATRATYALFAFEDSVVARSGIDIPEPEAGELIGIARSIAETLALPDEVAE